MSLNVSQGAPPPAERMALLGQERLRTAHRRPSAPPGRGSPSEPARKHGPIMPVHPLQTAALRPDPLLQTRRGTTREQSLTQPPRSGAPPGAHQRWPRHPRPSTHAPHAGMAPRLAGSMLAGHGDGQPSCDAGRLHRARGACSRTPPVAGAGRAPAEGRRAPPQSAEQRRAAAPSSDGPPVRSGRDRRTRFVAPCGGPVERRRSSGPPRHCWVVSQPSWRPRRVGHRRTVPSGGSRGRGGGPPPSVRRGVLEGGSE